jgi:hypothetical protein
MNRQSTFNIPSVALWDIFSSQTSPYFSSALCSILSQIWRRQVCFLPERKAANTRQQYADFCGKHRFVISITNIFLALQQFLRLVTSIRWWCEQTKWYTRSFSYAAFHPASRRLVKKTTINHENSVDKYSLHMLWVPQLVILIQDGKLRYTWACGAFP